MKAGRLSLLLHASDDNGVGIGFDQQNFLRDIDDDEIEIQRARSRRRDLGGSGAIGVFRIRTHKRPLRLKLEDRRNRCGSLGQRSRSVYQPPRSKLGLYLVTREAAEKGPYLFLYLLVSDENSVPGNTTMEGRNGSQKQRRGRDIGSLCPKTGYLPAQPLFQVN